MEGELADLNLPTVLVAPDKLKGTMSARDAASAIASALEGLGVRTETCPLSDGGEGFLEAFGGANRHSWVKGPLGDPVKAGWRLDGHRAIVEMAQASGLVAAGGPERNRPEKADTFGTGQLIAEALAAGAQEVIIGIGGSASTDGGRGCISALEGYVPFHWRVNVTVAADVTTRFLDAARVFAPQKGATPVVVDRLARRLEREAKKLEVQFGQAPLTVEGGGAAGGLAGALWAAGASIASGFEVVAHHVQLRRLVACADLVISAEGRLDSTSFDGKTTGSLIAMCGELRQEIGLVVGDADDKLSSSLSVPMVILSREFGLDASMANPKICLASGATKLLAKTNLGERGDRKRKKCKKPIKGCCPAFD